MKLFLASFLAAIISIVLAVYISPFNGAFSSIAQQSIALVYTTTVYTLASKALARLPLQARSASSAGIRPISNMSVPRTVRKHFLAREQAEGAGATVRRSIGGAELRQFSPFLMLDHFSISPGAGFPDHPHHGQETITYLIEGAVDHEDFTGSAGTIEAGDLQFMTAGRGIVHAEMPNPHHAKSVGMQLWVDLPSRLRDCEPRYRDLKAQEIPTAKTEDGKAIIKVISGRSQGVDSVKDLAYTPVWIFHMIIKPGGTVVQAIPQGWNSFAYILEGNAVIGAGNNATSVPQYHNAVFDSAGDEAVVSNSPNSSQDAQIILVAGQPHEQETVQYGPFVADSREDLQQVFMNYRTGSNGFERARDWESQIGKQMVH